MKFNIDEEPPIVIGPSTHLQKSYREAISYPEPALNPIFIVLLVKCEDVFSDTHWTRAYVMGYIGNDKFRFMDKYNDADRYKKTQK